MTDIWRCDVTKNPVGTDTRMVGRPCQCQGCRAAEEIERLRSALRLARVHVVMTNRAEGMMDGFGPKRRRSSDDELDIINAALNEQAE